MIIPSLFLACEVMMAFGIVSSSFLLFFFASKVVFCLLFSFFPLPEEKVLRRHFHAHSTSPQT